MHNDQSSQYLTYNLNSSLSTAPMPPKKQKAGPALTHAQEEEMSSALIAQLLAEDGMDTGGYYAEYGNDRGVYEQYRKHDTDDSYENESEDDYKPKQFGVGTRGKRGRGGKRGGSSRGGGGMLYFCSMFYNFIVTDLIA